MLCPEVWNFPPPKVITSCKRNQTVDSVLNTVKMNHFYKSLIITCPDETQTRVFNKIITEDSVYYKLSDCSITEFLEPVFIENFVKNGNFHCLSADRECIVQNCAAITPDGILTIHLLEFIFQTIGLEGIKRPHHFYEIKIDLKHLKHYDKVKQCLNKLEKFDFHILWEPHNEDVCPSSIAKYFYEKHVSVNVCTPEIKRIAPTITEIPSLDVDVEEIEEWIGMLVHNGDLTPKDPYFSTYSQPDSEYPIKSSNLIILTVKSFLTPRIIASICDHLTELVLSRDSDNYWASLSIQSYENSLWRWNLSSPLMFQAHNSSTNMFFQQKDCVIYTIGQLKYS